MSSGLSNAPERESAPRQEPVPDRTSQNTPILAVEGVSREFQGRTVLRSISLGVQRGETLALLGPNGAGKTTLLRIMSTISRPTTGKILIGGIDSAKADANLRRAIGFLGHQTYLYDDLTAEENLRFYARLYDIPDVESRIDQTLVDVGLESRRQDRVRIFSRGMQQRLSLAESLLHRPLLLLLDEPDSGLDPEATRTLRRLLQDVQVPERSIVLATHDFEFAYEMADRFAILVSGRLMWQGSKTELPAGGLQDVYRATILGSLDRTR